MDKKIASKTRRLLGLLNRSYNPHSQKRLYDPIDVSFKALAEIILYQDLIN